MKKYPELNDVSQAALIRAAQTAVAGALAGDFPADPIIGTELSRAMSCIGSVVKRHGKLIEMAIAGALVASDRFIVVPNAELPLTKGAAQLLDAKNSDLNLSKIKLSVDSEADGIVNVDLVVVDPEASWAGVYEIKRGNGVTEHGKRRPILRKLKAGRLVLASYVRQLGYGHVETVTSAVIDYCGASGFDPNFTLTRDQLDEHFGVPVVATVDAVTAAAREALEVELPTLLGPVFDRMTLPTQEATAATLIDNEAPTEDAAMRGSVVRTLTAPPTGPGMRASRNPQTRH